MKRHILLTCLLLLICCVIHAAKIETLKVKQELKRSIVNITITGQFKHKLFKLPHPERVVVDFEQTTSTINVHRIVLGKGMIVNIRSGYASPRTLRLVFDVNQSVQVRTTNLINRRQRGLQLEFLPSGIKSPITQKTNNVHYATTQRLRNVVVVLDPGHGGKDPGARGPRHSAEKNITLAIAKKLKDLIDRQPGMRAVLTRNGDYYVGLRERLNIARKDNADIFISIHADAFINRHSHGASVFALSQRGATSEAARWLAEKENYSELGGVNLSHLDDRNGLIRTVLLDLSQTATISASLQMGKRVLLHLDKMTNLHNSSVEQARFVVLKSPDIPSILIETGFITNPREEKNLTSSYYQSQLTLAILAGLKQYFWDYPPHGTRLEAWSNMKLHVVRKGENLPNIAKYYHVAVNTIKAANHLPDEHVVIGQKLSIPSSWA